MSSSTRLIALSELSTFGLPDMRWISGSTFRAIARVRAISLLGVGSSYVLCSLCGDNHFSVW
jgi:hypothetical protein